MKVVKFGGSSLATGSQVQKVLDIIQADEDRRIVVVSAPGKRFDGDIKVTDLLKSYADHTIAGADTTEILMTILARYQEIAAHFLLEDDVIISQIKQQLIHLNRVHYPSFDHLYAAFMGHGELLNAQLIAAVMQKKGLPATFVSPAELGITVTGSPRSARLDQESYHAISNYQIDDSRLLIIPGFIAYTNDGYAATFSRGGSDITGAILARGFHADLYENFTDVSAIYTVNPKIVPHPQSISEMTYREMRELSYAGFAVFHDEAIIPVIEANIPINVKNTNDPQAPGTMIMPNHAVNPSNPVTGIANDNRFAALYLHRYLLNREVGFTLKILQILATYNVSYEHMPSGIDDMTIIFDKAQLTPEIKAHISHDIYATIAPDELEWLDDYAIIMIVGEGMQQHIGTFSKITAALSEAGINLPMINQGASQISTMIGVPVDRMNEAVHVIYHAVF